MRGAADMLTRQLENYQEDPRAIFIYTFTPYNIEEAGSREIGRASCRERV